MRTIKVCGVSFLFITNKHPTVHEGERGREGVKRGMMVSKWGWDGEGKEEVGGRGRGLKKKGKGC